jgi:hypothetical protein
MFAVHKNDVKAVQTDDLLDLSDHTLRLSTCTVCSSNCGYTVCSSNNATTDTR